MYQRAYDYEEVTITYYYKEWVVCEVLLRMYQRLQGCVVIAPFFTDNRPPKELRFTDGAF